MNIHGRANFSHSYSSISFFSLSRSRDFMKRIDTRNSKTRTKLGLMWETMAIRLEKRLKFEENPINLEIEFGKCIT